MAEETTTKQRKVLLVDDDQFLLNMYSMKFKKSGYEVDAASSGSNALEKLRSGGIYDVIIFDVVMPTMDGFEFAETVRKEKLVPGAALVALTNQGQAEDIERGKKVGVDGYIVKASAVPSEVVNEINVILEQKNN
ncbi:MAG TPA: response regulator [Candidatus Paceibacterota bacterium]